MMIALALFMPINVKGKPWDQTARGSKPKSQLKYLKLSRPVPSLEAVQLTSDNAVIADLGEDMDINAPFLTKRRWAYLTTMLEEGKMFLAGQFCYA